MRYFFCKRYSLLDAFLMMLGVFVGAHISISAYLMVWVLLLFVFGIEAYWELKQKGGNCDDL